ncbi:hypothetical protein [Legionella nagasakiensis]|uniref:hypothetical protein n=1 Tax=Legionella nagasakiensis TaxID=535290 RepID=UPI001054B513|nr:hypothetical protein [Legionella nagasakiensis]
MSAFTDALSQLKADIEAIAGKKFVYDTKKLSASDANQVFAAQRLLPESLRTGATGFVPPTRSDYSDNVLQAIWNIADLTTQIAEGHTSLARQLMSFRKSFGYLDKKTWVPKIIDDKTYQAGLAMQRFLALAVPDPEAREKGLTDLLQGLQQELDKRLLVYVTHTPESIDKTVDYLQHEEERQQQAREQTAAWKAQHDDLQQLIGEESIQRLLRPGKELLASGSDDITAIDAMIADREHVLAQIRERATQFLQFNRRWKENIDRHFPNIISDYHRLLANPGTTTIGDITTAWKHLFNTGTHIEQNATKQALEHLHNEGVTACDHEVPRIVELFETQMAQLLEVRKLAVYKQQLKEATAVKEITTPDFITGEGSTLAYVISLSSAEDELTRLTENSESYTALIAGLKHYSAQLMEQQRALEERDDQLDSTLSPPAPYAAKETFRTALEKTHVTLLEEITRIRTQRDRIQQLITTATQEHQPIEEARAKQTREGREQLLHAAEEKEEETLKIAQASEAKKAEKQATFASMIEPEGIEEALEQLRHHEAARREALRMADESLARFAQAIENRSSLYIPAQEVPKEDLKRYLECNEAIGQFIDELYKREQQAGAWYGINTTYVFDLFQHHTSIVYSDFDADMEDILYYIQAKRAQIAAELAVDITQPPSGTSPSQSLSEVNLYKLQQRYQEIIEPRKVRERQKQELAHLEVQTQLDNFAHEHAVLEHRMLKLEFKLNEAQMQANGLPSLLTELDSLSPDKALAHIRRHETMISQLQNLLTISTFKDRSCEEQVRQIARRLTAQNTAWQTFNEGIPDSETLLAEQAEQKETLAGQLQQLNEQNDRLSQQYDELSQLVATIIRKKESLQLQQLTQIAHAMHALASRTDDSASLATPDKIKLHKAIQKQLAALNASPLLAEASGSKKRAIADQLEIIDGLKPRLSSAARTLRQATGVYDDEEIETVSSVRHDRLTALKTRFFGSHDTQLGGIFGDYLKERASTFSWRDFFSRAAALVLGCFSYQTEAEKRQVYLHELKSAVIKYQTNPATYGDLSSVIQKGLQHFKPRAKSGPDYRKSLHAKLNTFNQELTEALTAKSPEVEAPRSTFS